MNHLKLPRLLLCAAAAFIFTSCGNNKTKSSTETTETNRMDTGNAPVTSTTTTSRSTIDTAPQNMMVVRHRVANYSKWKPSYDAHDSMRLANGIHNYVIGRGVDDTNMVMVALKIDDIAKAKSFAKNASLKQAMQKGGVVGTPMISFVTLVFQDTARLNSDIRSLNTFTVKDWAAWKRSFESNKQLRMENGMQDRAYGYDVDDNHKVTLALAFIDTAKARAFQNSDLIKQKRTESGVVSKPQMFRYRVVKKY